MSANPVGATLGPLWISNYSHFNFLTAFLVHQLPVDFMRWHVHESIAKVMLVMQQHF